MHVVTHQPFLQMCVLVYPSNMVCYLIENIFDEYIYISHIYVTYGLWNFKLRFYL